jgi:hypothetical protein
MLLRHLCAIPRRLQRSISTGREVRGGFAVDGNKPLIDSRTFVLLIGSNGHAGRSVPRRRFRARLMCLLLCSLDEASGPGLRSFLSSTMTNALFWISGSPALTIDSRPCDPRLSLHGRVTFLDRGTREGRSGRTSTLATPLAALSPFQLAPDTAPPVPVRAPATGTSAGRVFCRSRC